MEAGEEQRVGGIPPASGWAVRQLVESLGHTVSHPQLAAYITAGLLPGWPARGVEAHVEQLRQVCELGQTVRSIPRRVLLLRANFFEFPIAEASIVDALAAITSTVAAPKRKLRVMDGVLRRAIPQLYTGWYTATALPQTAYEKQRWPYTLRAVNEGIRAAWIHGTYSVVNNLIPQRVDEPRLETIPFEEQVLLVSVLVAVRQYRVTP